ncbi:hypothetical protein C1H46_011544 [Malus baccata]|uniref:Uncharacterized protein n=1 Tax=Malus baccata TaxID=106549 RepID=A0A540MVI7_MALBA|nr:hypothetical protein C1H46_011544 [Malus baccata]
MTAATLHAIAILLKRAKDWDLFINLGASDYPLMCQDDLLHIFSFLPRELNFLEHTSNIGWKENKKARPVIIVPGLYHSMKSGVYWARERRSIPASFKLYMEGYFHTVACSHKDYQNTSVNHNLHYIRRDSPLKANPIILTLEHYNDMVQSGAPFAGTFARDDCETCCKGVEQLIVKLVDSENIRPKQCK